MKKNTDKYSMHRESENFKIPSRKEYCSKKAKENTYDEYSSGIDAWTGSPIERICHHISKPKDWYNEYDRLYNIKYIRSVIEQNMKKCEELNNYISQRTENWKSKDFPTLPEMIDDNLMLYREINEIVFNRLQELERISEWVS